VVTRRRGRPVAGDPSALSTERLLDAALDAFADRGYDGTSVREIARDLGVSHNLIPQRIGSKDQLWRCAVDRGFGQLTIALAGALADDPGTDLARLRAVVVRFVEANAARPALSRIIAQEAAAPGPRFDHLFSYIDPIRVLGADLMGRLREAGQLRTDSVTLVYFFMTHGAGGALALPALAERLGGAVDPHDPKAVRDHAQAAVDVLFDGLVAR
jgi:TetR/AcrR family transcriptional regulator